MVGKLEPLGFPNCQPCPYMRNGPWQVCYGCARKSVPPVASGACSICSQTRPGLGQPCANALCNDPDRCIAHIDAIAALTGPLRTAIHRYKYQGKHGWALIFGRLLLGYLEEHARVWIPDLVIANPTFVTEGSPMTGHIERIVDQAEKWDLAAVWPFDITDPRAVVLLEEPRKSAGKSYREKKDAAFARAPLHHIPDRSRIRGGRILIFDDVCTTGWQLEILARCLLEAGAAEVRAVVLARASWSGAPETVDAPQVPS